MVDALLADGAEQRALQAAQTARADDEQIGILRLLHEHLGRLADDGTTFAVDSGL